jgi:hypothetical protein
LQAIASLLVFTCIVMLCPFRGILLTQRLPEGRPYVRPPPDRCHIASSRVRTSGASVSGQASRTPGPLPSPSSINSIPQPSYTRTRSINVLAWGTQPLQKAVLGSSTDPCEASADMAGKQVAWSAGNLSTPKGGIDHGTRKPRAHRPTNGNYCRLG